jgi:hypothetical protein
MVDGGVAVGAGPDEFQNGVHQSLFGITYTAHSRQNFRIFSQLMLDNEGNVTYLTKRSTTFGVFLDLGAGRTCATGRGSVANGSNCWHF